jgi:hypothetical protein
MSRNIPARLMTSLASNPAYPFFAFEGLFDAGTLRLWTGQGNKTLNTNTYYGSGDLLSISEVAEKADMSAASLTVTLSGQNSASIANALATPFQNRKCNIYLGAWTNSTLAAYDMIKIFSGFMDRMPLNDSGDNSTIQIIAESVLNELDRTIDRRYTQESQKVRYSTDTFFSYVTDLQDKDILWGRSS